MCHTTFRGPRFIFKKLIHFLDHVNPYLVPESAFVLVRFRIIYVDHFLGQINPYLVVESAFVLVRFGVIFVGHVTQSPTGLSHVLD